MTLNTKYISIMVLVILITGFGIFSLYRNQTPKTETVTTSSSGDNMTPSKNPSSVTPPIKEPTKTSPTTTNTSGFFSYSNVEYNFSIKFPSYTQTRNVFSTFHEVGNTWRLYPQPANQGKGILELSIFNIDQGTYSTGRQKYPLYFASLVRVGVSPNIKECYTADAGYTNQKITNVVINGVTFKKFSTSENSMMKYVQAESYRTIHNKMCFVLEQIKAGTSYRDEKMGAGIADSSLTNYYNEGATIIQTFKFTK